MTMFPLLMGAPADGSAPNPFLVMVPYLFILLIFYFLLIRPQQKRASEHRKFLEALKKNDAVVTDSGIFGTIISDDGDSVILKIAENVKIRVLKGKLAGPARDASVEPARKGK